LEPLISRMKEIIIQAKWWANWAFVRIDNGFLRRNNKAAILENFPSLYLF
jgi:hypothetical protein